MSYTTRVPAAVTVAPPGHRLLSSFPIACFTCALLTDAAYATTTQVMWVDFSDWLLAVGFGVGLLAGLVGLIDLFAHWRVRAGRPATIYLIGGLVVLGLAGLNNFVHSRDAWTSVVPTGLALSAATVVMMLLVAWIGGRSARAEIVVEPRIGAGI